MKVLLVLLVGLVFLLNSCRRCEEPATLITGSFGFTLSSLATGNDLFDTSAYSIDSVRVFNKDGWQLGQASKYSAAANQIESNIFSNTETARAAMSTTKTVILYLVLNSTDTDTLKIECRGAENGRCDEEFESLKLYYNDSLQFHGTNALHFNMVLYKK